MRSEIYVHREGTEIQVAYLEDNKLMELYVEESESTSLLGNIYKARVADVLPGMNAAFVDIGLMKNAFLFINDILTPHLDQELISAEDIDMDVEKPDTIPLPRPAIEDLLRRGEEILVQISKDAKGTKNVRVSMKITVPGKYLVYLPTMEHIGISHRITDEVKREEIISFVREHTPKGTGFIIRTRSAMQPLDILRQEMDELISKWETIKSRQEKADAPKLVYADIGILGRVLRDLIDDNVRLIESDDRILHQEMDELLKKEWSSHPVRLRLTAEGVSSFEKHNIDIQLRQALLRKVPLKSGGYLVIDQTEALTTIDVNTGSFIGVDNPEETALVTNIEAAKVSLQQIRLRNLSGMILIDFIDMKNPGNPEKLLNIISEGIQQDRVRTNLVQYSDLGLVELTRKRIRKTLQSHYLEECPACRGQGFVPSFKMIRSDIIKKMKKEIRDGWTHVTVQLHPRMASALRNDESFTESVSYQFGLKVEIESIMDVAMDTIKVLPG